MYHLPVPRGLGSDDFVINDCFSERLYSARAGCRQPQDFIAMRADQFGVDGSSDQPGERGQAFRVAVNVQALVGEIADARREETDAAIRRGAGVSTVLDHYGLGFFA